MQIFLVIVSELAPMLLLYFALNKFVLDKIQFYGYSWTPNFSYFSSSDNRWPPSGYKIYICLRSQHSITIHSKVVNLFFSDHFLLISKKHTLKLKVIPHSKYPCSTRHSEGRNWSAFQITIFQNNYSELVIRLMKNRSFKITSDRLLGPKWFYSAQQNGCMIIIYGIFLHGKNKKPN